MDPFASAANLAAKLGITEDALDSDRATLALENASGVIRDRCGWSISRETVTDTLDGDGGRSLWLPTLKLVDVASVAVGGQTLTVEKDFDWTAYGKLIRAGHWPHRPRSITITYTHGYDPVPDGVRAVCLKLAVSSYENTSGGKNRSETFGPFIEATSYQSASSLDADDMATLGRYVLEVLG